MANHQDVFDSVFKIDKHVIEKVGYFNVDKAQSVDESRHSNGKGFCSGGVGTYQKMWLTASNKWVLQMWTDLGGEENSSWQYVENDFAKNWFSRSKLPILEEKDPEPEDDELDSKSEPVPDPESEPKPKPKRKRGRPRKKPESLAESLDKVVTQSKELGEDVKAAFEQTNSPVEKLPTSEEDLKEKDSTE